mmetsp:Transcript_152756/g.490007  ORF Transcript_152756/g.490007 Transcript_152756/m.490007 type:complete len:111 (+) Transcript_152756:759-1091(+)
MEDKTAYDNYLDTFRGLVPDEHFWETEIRNMTYEKLAGFLELPLPRQSGALPRTKMAGLGKLWIRMYLHPLRHLTCFAFLSAHVLVNWMIFCAIWAWLFGAGVEKGPKVD